MAARLNIDNRPSSIRYELAVFDIHIHFISTARLDDIARFATYDVPIRLIRCYGVGTLYPEALRRAVHDRSEDPRVFTVKLHRFFPFQKPTEDPRLAVVTHCF
jgi:hypothetical protein